MLGELIRVRVIEFTLYALLSCISRNLVIGRSDIEIGKIYSMIRFNRNDSNSVGVLYNAYIRVDGGINYTHSDRFAKTTSGSLYSTMSGWIEYRRLYIVEVVE
jgi:hypothetical protein